MAILIKLEKSTKNSTKSSYGKWYGQTVHPNTITTRDLAKKIEQNSTFKESDVVGVLLELKQAMKEYLQDSCVVELEGIGRFRAVAQLEGVDDPKKLDLKRDVKDLTVKFMPSRHSMKSSRKMEIDLLKGAKVERYNR